MSPLFANLTVDAALRSCRLPRLEARMLLEHVLQQPRAWLLAHGDARLTAETARAFFNLVERRLAGEPMAYIVGQREFMGHVFEVTPDVLIPRPDTELLVETALAWLARPRTIVLGGAKIRVLDLGTGSGAIAISLALARPDIEVWGSDASPAALAVAQRNAVRLGASVRWCSGDWFAAVTNLPESQLDAHPLQFDLIVANPPYLAADDSHLQQGDLRFEPRMALSDQADGLQALRTIIAQARAWLRAKGALWLEHGWDQAAAVHALLRAGGWVNIASHRDLAGLERISGGELP